MEEGPADFSREHEPADATELGRLARRVSDLEQQVATLAALVGSQACVKTAQVVVTTPAFTPAPPSSPLPPPLPQSFHVDPVPSPAAERVTRVAGPAASGKSLEDRIGSQVFNLIGIVALLFGAAWALKLAIEHGLIGPVARIIIGLVAGAGLIVWSELFRRRNLAAFSYTLKAVGTGILYLSLWAAFQIFGLITAPVALVGMVLVTAWNAFMALTQDAELLASYALIGALLTPVLLSTGGDHETFLFVYLAAIDLGVVVLQRFNAWPRQLLPAYLATVAYFVGYYSRFFHPQNPAIAVWDSQSSETALFTVIFGGIFALVSMRFWTRGENPPPAESSIIAPVLIPLGNAAFVSLVLYSVFQDSGLHDSLAWLMVGLAALFLGLIPLQRNSLARAMHLASAVVFLTIAIPLKLSGQALTTAWLVEGLVLYWAATRVKAETKAPSLTLGLLSLGGYALGLLSVLFHWTWRWAVDSGPQTFFNSDLGSAMVAVAALAGAGWLALTQGDAADRKNLRISVAGSACLIAGIGLLLTLREVESLFAISRHHDAFANPDFFTALVGLGLIGAVAAVAWRIHSQTQLSADDRRLVRLLSYALQVLFHLVTILTFEREIGALFTNAEAELQRSLALSGFLMLYGAILLAAGFLYRNAFVRWQALALLLFTIAKVFLYDISGLSAGYRVVSFLALGVVLLTVSYAYQKDWLALKRPAEGGGQAV